MQTLTIQVQDNFLPQFLDYIKCYKESLSIQKDENLKYDPYYYERKKDLEEVIRESENGTMQILSQEQANKEIKSFFQDLKSNANL